MTMPRPVTAHRMGATLGPTGAGDVGILRTHAGTVDDLTPTTLRLGYVTVSRRRTETEDQDVITVDDATVPRSASSVSAPPEAEKRPKLMRSHARYNGSSDDLGREDAQVTKRGVTEPGPTDHSPNLADDPVTSASSVPAPSEPGRQRKLPITTHCSITRSSKRSRTHVLITRRHA
jgi:hypothetical protein